MWKMWKLFISLSWQLWEKQELKVRFSKISAARDRGLKRRALKGGVGPGQNQSIYLTSRLLNHFKCSWNSSLIVLNMTPNNFAQCRRRNKSNMWKMEFSSVWCKKRQTIKKWKDIIQIVQWVRTRWSKVQPRKLLAVLFIWLIQSANYLTRGPNIVILPVCFYVYIYIFYVYILR